MECLSNDLRLVSNANNNACDTWVIQTNERVLKLLFQDLPVIDSPRDRVTPACWFGDHVISVDHSQFVPPQRKSQGCYDKLT